MAKKLAIDINDILSNTNNKVLPIFNFEYEHKKVRTIYIDGEIWFVAKDVAEILGYTNPLKAIRDHCKGVNETFTPSSGGLQLTKIIPESDVYRLIFRSKLPESERFEDWVTKEVLPSIRKTGKYETEKVESLSDDEIRVMVRNTLKSHEKEIHRTLKNHAGMTEGQQYAIWHSCGYQGLYELSSPVNAVKRIAKIKGIELKKGETPLNYMDAEELGINIYHITQAEAMLKRDKYTPEEANQITFDLGKSIVEEIKARGNRPPIQIPAVEHIKKAEKRLTVIKKQEIAEELIYAYDGVGYKIDEINSLTINFNTDITINNIWVIGLFFAFFKEEGTISTSELLEMIPKYYTFTEENKQLSKSTNEPKYIQKIKNIKSNRNNKTNPIFLGLFDDVKNGFKITPKGIEVVKNYIYSKRVENKD